MSSVRDPSRVRAARPRQQPAPRVVDERAYLYEIIQTIGSGPDLQTILRGVVRLATEATVCHACLVWFIERDRLTLRAASPPYEHLAGSVDMAVGEGLAGWVAKTRRSAFIKERALEDPRVKYFPEFEEERFQSLVAVPMLGRDDGVMGVISLHAEAPHEFAREDLDFLEHTAALIAGAVENARLYEEARARVALLSDLSDLSQRVASASGQQEVLEIVTRGVTSLLAADRCELYRLEADGKLRLAAAHPSRPGPPPLDTRTLWLDVLLGEQGPGPSEDARKLALLLWGGEASGSPHIAPLVVGDERLGILVASLPAPTADAEAVLSAIAAHTAVALKQHQAIERLREKNLVKDFFVALARADGPPDELADLARRLGCDLAQPHVVLHVVPWTAPARSKRGGRRPRDRSWSELAGQVEGRLGRGSRTCSWTTSSDRCARSCPSRERARARRSRRSARWTGAAPPTAAGSRSACPSRAAALSRSREGSRRRGPRPRWVR